MKDVGRKQSWHSWRNYPEFIWMHWGRLGSRNDSVGIMSELQIGRPRNHGSIPCRGEIFVLLQCLKTCSGSHPPSYPTRTGRYFPWRKPDLFRPSCAKVRINLLATDFFFQLLAHPVFKMWIIQKPNKVALWNKRHFEEKKMEIIQHV